MWPEMNTVTMLTSFYGVGTFARVWLARLRGHDGGNDKLYALKVLRKAEGGLHRYFRMMKCSLQRSNTAQTSRPCQP
jgi:hypothetical protein